MSIPFGTFGNCDSDQRQRVVLRVIGGVDTGLSACAERLLWLPDDPNLNGDIRDEILEHVYAAKALTAKYVQRSHPYPEVES